VKRKKSPSTPKKRTAPDEILSRAEHTFNRSNKGNSVVIVRLDNDAYFFRLDDVAAEFWNLIDGKRTVTQICKLIQRKHAPPPDVLDRAVKLLLKDLKQHRLILSKKA